MLFGKYNNVEYFKTFKLPFAISANIVLLLVRKK